MKKQNQQQERTPEPLLPLSPVIFYILVLLAKSELHGYRLLQLLEERLQGMSSIGSATLHRTLQYLLKENIIAVSQKRPDPDVDIKRRIYYELTDFGRCVARAEQQRLVALLQETHAEHLFEDDPDPNDPHQTGSNPPTSGNPGRNGIANHKNGDTSHVNQHNNAQSQSLANDQWQHRARVISSCTPQCHDEEKHHLLHSSDYSSPS